MIISTSLHCLVNSATSASWNSLLISLAYPPYKIKLKKWVGAADRGHERNTWPVPSSLTLTSRNSAPRDCTCSLTAGRVSNPRTIAPILYNDLANAQTKGGSDIIAGTIRGCTLACAMADKPATPAPITKIFAGGICEVQELNLVFDWLVHHTFPAAVIWPPRNLLKLFAASTTALYPAMFAIEDKASNTCTNHLFPSTVRGVQREV